MMRGVHERSDHLVARRPDIGGHGLDRDRRSKRGIEGRQVEALAVRAAGQEGPPVGGEAPP